MVVWAMKLWYLVLSTGTRCPVFAGTGTPWSWRAMRTGSWSSLGSGNNQTHPCDLLSIWFWIDIKVPLHDMKEHNEEFWNNQPHCSLLPKWAVGCEAMKSRKVRLMVYNISLDYVNLFQRLADSRNNAKSWLYKKSRTTSNIFQEACSTTIVLQLLTKTVCRIILNTLNSLRLTKLRRKWICFNTTDSNKCIFMLWKCTLFRIYLSSPHLNKVSDDQADKVSRNCLLLT